MEEPESWIVFSSAVEGLYLRGLKGRLTPQLLGRIKQIGIDVEGKLLPAYALDVWAEALCETARSLYPDKPLEDACAELGKLTLEGLRETTMGAAIFPVFRLLGPKRILHRMTRSLRNGSNFIETKVVKDAEKDVEIWFNCVRQVGFYQGVLEAGMIAAGAQEVSVGIAAREGESVVYRVRWS